LKCVNSAFSQTHGKKAVLKHEHSKRYRDCCESRIFAKRMECGDSSPLSTTESCKRYVKEQPRVTHSCPVKA